MRALSPAPSRELAGVRLGELERTLLMAAPPLGTLGGLLIKAPEGTRSAQQGYLRAAKKLERHRLVKRVHLWEATSAYDPRRERPLYRRGGFWLRAKASRRHLVRRVAIWVTPFGEGIRRAYERELTGGLPIRWTPARVGRAQRFEDTTWRNPTEQEIARDDLQAALSSAEEEEPELREIWPTGVSTDASRERWQLCIVLARRKHPGVGSARLWGIACELLGSDAATSSLRKRAGVLARPASERPSLRFRRTHLGLIIRTRRG